MPTPEIRILGLGGYCEAVDETPPDLAPLLGKSVGPSLRRMRRFIRLALLGATRCVGEGAPSPETGIFLTTGRGDFELTVEMIQQLVRDGEPPTPLSLINSVSNAACFYLARQFGLHGAGACVGGGYFGFETLLQLAQLDLELGRRAEALVGTTDMVIAPVPVHRRRLDRPDGAPIAEASHWLWLGAEADAGPGPVLAGVELFTDREALLAWTSRLPIPTADTLFAAGQHLDPDAADELQRTLGLARALDYRAGRPYYDCQAGAAAEVFLSGSDGSAMLHVNGDPHGRYAAFLVRR
jgi:hypothetical protein